MCCEVVVGEMELRRKVSSLCARTARLSFHLECNALNVNKSDALDNLGTSRIKHGDCNSSTLKERRRERAWSARNTSVLVRSERARPQSRPHKDENKRRALSIFGTKGATYLWFRY
jgi:hypothetical protein